MSPCDFTRSPISDCIALAALTRAAISRPEAGWRGRGLGLGSRSSGLVVEEIFVVAIHKSARWARGCDAQQELNRSHIGPGFEETDHERMPASGT